MMRAGITKAAAGVAMVMYTGERSNYNETHNQSEGKATRSKDAKE